MVEFNNKRDQLPAQLKNNIDKIKQCLEDKTSNIYKMNTKNNQKLLKENITMKLKRNTNQTRKSNQF